MSTIKERQRLDEFCEDRRSCDGCPLDTPEHRCGNGSSFADETHEDGYMSDEEIIRAYAVAFPQVEDLKSADMVDHPKHYGREGAMECIEEMILVFGVKATMCFCLLNAWKYRYRAADKGGEEDMKKSDWYMAKYKELKEAD